MRSQDSDFSEEVAVPTTDWEVGKIFDCQPEGVDARI